MKSKIDKIISIFLNLLSNKRYVLSYVAESRDWVIGQLGKEITNNLSIKSRMTTSRFLLRNQIVHFGSVNTFLKKDKIKKSHKSNKQVLSWFHLVPNNKINQYIREAQKYLSFIHTTCSITSKGLIDLGVEEKKIITIPLGIDLSLFKPGEKELNLPKDKIIIGSFQKDGVGWKKGLEPKLIKGPDIFVESVTEINKKHPVFILLVGPARGYVRESLKQRGIPFKSIGYLKDFKDIVQYYRELDLYLITSRIEGGPRSFFEAWATKTPLVSTRVGMVPDIAKDRHDILLADNKEEIVEKAIEIIENKGLRESLKRNAFLSVQNYSLEKIAQRHYDEIYSKLL